MSVAPRGTFWVAAAAVLSLVSPGAWGAWQGAGARNASLASAKLGYSLSGSNVTGGGTGFSWGFLLSLGGATDHLSVTNTGSVAETIKATMTVSGLNVGTNVTVYGCANTFTGTSCTGRVTLATVPGSTPTQVTLATNLAAGSTYNIAISVPGLLGLTVTVAMPANSFTVTPRTGINRTSG